MNNTPKNIFENHLNKLKDGRVYGLLGSGVALYLAMSAKPFLMIEKDEESALKLFRDVKFYMELMGKGENLFFLPDPDSPEMSGARAIIVEQVTGGGNVSVIAGHEAMLAQVWNPDALKSKTLVLEAGDELDRAIIEQELLALGYFSAPLVTAPGQFSLRGFILDIYPTTEERAYRVEFFGDEIDVIRVFDIETQRSVTEVDDFRLMPANEPDNNTNIDSGVSFISLIKDSDIYITSAIEVDTPQEGSVELSSFSIEGEGTEAGFLPIAGEGILPDERKDVYELPSILLGISAKRKVMIVCSAKGQAERLHEVFTEAGVLCPHVEPNEALEYEGSLFITVGNLSEGFSIPGLMVLTERELFGGRPAYRAMRRSKVGTLLSSIDDLEAGDFVVHADKGIGRFIGLVHEEIEGMGYDLLAIEYSGGARLFIPVGSIDAIRKYHAEEGRHPSLDILGGKKWLKTRAKVQKRVKIMAGKLLKLYAGRELAKSVPSSVDTEMHREFDSFFPYEETPDQITAIAEIKRDMEDVKSMDRLLCGDVGYGKTEVAMRAAFRLSLRSRLSTVPPCCCHTWGT